MKRVLFVCIANYCRSPAAEAIFNKLIHDHGRAEELECESAGVGSSHTGRPADPRMRRPGEARGYSFETRSRLITAEDFSRFDLIVTMDHYVATVLLGATPDVAEREKIVPMARFHPDPALDQIPDPYTRDDLAFEGVLDLLEVACRNLFDSLIESPRASSKEPGDAAQPS